jgi:hypothetical protein
VAPADKENPDNSCRKEEAQEDSPGVPAITVASITVSRSVAFGTCACRRFDADRLPASQAERRLVRDLFTAMQAEHDA